jgi:hypothetical protein
MIKSGEVEQASKSGGAGRMLINGGWAEGF